jgi:hypothetical protein
MLYTYANDIIRNLYMPPSLQNPLPDFTDTGFVVVTKDTVDAVYEQSEGNWSQ